MECYDITWCRIMGIVAQEQKIRRAKQRPSCSLCLFFVLSEYKQKQSLSFKSSCSTTITCTIPTMRWLVLSIEYSRYYTQMKVAVRCALCRKRTESVTGVGSSVNKVSDYRYRNIFCTHGHWRLQKLAF